jgi:hypothetical protein
VKVSSAVGAAVLAILLIAGGTIAQESRIPFVYVSGYRPDISIFRLDTAGGKLIPAGNMPGGQEPSFLAGMSFPPAVSRRKIEMSGR